MKKKQKQKKQSQKKLKMKFWMKLHAVFTVFLLVFYVTLGMFGGLGVFGNDLKDKYARAAGVTLGVVIDALPARPILSATMTCTNDISNINLSWIQSDGAISYAITRDGLPLVSGIQVMSYVDSNVVAGVDYTYIVTASGSSGDAVSDPLTVTAKDCFIIEKPDPILTLVSFDGKEVIQGVELVTTKKTFKITGTTNMSYANIQIKTLPGPVFVSTLQANLNGYWEYFLPGQLNDGSYSFQIMATDPESFLRNITKNYAFKIESTGGDGGGGDHGGGHGGGHTTTTPGNGSGGIVVIPPKPPVEEADMNLIVQNKDDKVFRGQDLQFELIFRHKDKISTNVDKVYNLEYNILDKKNAIVFSVQASEKIPGNVLKKTLLLPGTLPDGKYKIRASLSSDNKILTSEKNFTFLDMPIVNFGGGITATYCQVVSAIGWLLIISLLLLIIFLLMFLIEYFLFREALFTVDEYDLAKRGMIPFGKGVAK